MPNNANPIDQEAADGEGQPLVEHLIELRSRLLKCVGFVMIIFVPLFLFANDIYSYMPLLLDPVRSENTLINACSLRDCYQNTDADVG